MFIAFFIVLLVTALAYLATCPILLLLCERFTLHFMRKYGRLNAEESAQFAVCLAHASSPGREKLFALWQRPEDALLRRLSFCAIWVTTFTISPVIVAVIVTGCLTGFGLKLYQGLAILETYMPELSV